MAAGHIVPWTDPGGMPCCCAAECYTNFATDPFGNNLAEGQWQQINVSDYAALYAGGAYAGRVVASLTGERVVIGVPRFETQTTDTSLTMSVVESLNGGCYRRLQSVGNMLVFATRDGGFSTSYQRSPMRAFIALGTLNGDTYINMSSVTSTGISTQMGFVAAYFSTVFASQASFFGNIANRIAILASNQQTTLATATINLVVNGNTYTQQGIFVQTNVFGTLENTFTGNATLTITFTPSAP